MLDIPPHIPDTVYCNEQICIPPTFPYLLRQYAKAAIRSQPTDLLKWSTAYFRALSKGVEPPVKSRLEYPAPRQFMAVTPAWLRMLIRQLEGRITVSWPLLVDRWLGACLDLKALVHIVLVGGFSDPRRVPWYEFVAVAAAHLTQNLTDTMILICDLLTEEPSGGSSCIPQSVFCALYVFLAALDASVSRTVRNNIYTESNISLFRSDGSGRTKGSSMLLPESIGPTEEMEDAKSAESGLGKVTGDSMGGLEAEEEELVVQDSIPSLNLTKYLHKVNTDQKDEDTFGSISTIMMSSAELRRRPKTKKALSEMSCLDDTDRRKTRDHDRSPTAKTSSSSEKTESLERNLQIFTSEKTLVGEEMISYEGDMMIHEDEMEIEAQKEEESSSAVTSTTELYRELAEIQLEVVPGIGATVPMPMVEEVISYVKEVSLKQQGMIMPRNIKHFLCPPLEFMEY